MKLVKSQGKANAVANPKLKAIPLCIQKMSEEQLTQQFFQWVDQHEDDLSFSVAFDRVSGSTVFFLLDSEPFSIDCNGYQLSTQTSQSAAQNWGDWAIRKIQDNLHKIDSLFSCLNMIVAKYSDFKDEDDEWQSSEDDNSDYHAQVLDEYETDQQEVKQPEQSDFDSIEVAPEIENRLQAISDKFSGQGSAAANKRIIQEYKLLISSKEFSNIQVNFENDTNLYIWNAEVDVSQFDLSRDLKADFQQYSKTYNRSPAIRFEVRFNSDFPFSPPFLRIVSPRFQFRTGHVTVGGSICMQSLTRSGWIPVRTVESIFVEILFNMGEGGARLDVQGSRVEYSLHEAREAFDRVARQHDWL